MPEPAKRDEKGGKGKQSSSLTAALKKADSSGAVVRKPVAKLEKDKHLVGGDRDEEDKFESRVVDVHADSLLNKDEFYRRQLQNHSVSMFHRQIATRAANDAGTKV